MCIRRQVKKPSVRSFLSRRQTTRALGMRQRNYPSIHWRILQSSLFLSISKWRRRSRSEGARSGLPFKMRARARLAKGFLEENILMQEGERKREREESVIPAVSRNIHALASGEQRHACVSLSLSRIIVFGRNSWKRKGYMRGLLPLEGGPYTLGARTTWWCTCTVRAQTCVCVCVCVCVWALDYWNFVNKRERWARGYIKTFIGFACFVFYHK